MIEELLICPMANLIAPSLGCREHLADSHVHSNAEAAAPFDAPVALLGERALFVPAIGGRVEEERKGWSIGSGELSAGKWEEPSSKGILHGSCVEPLFTVFE